MDELIRIINAYMDDIRENHGHSIINYVRSFVSEMNKLILFAIELSDFEKSLINLLRTVTGISTTTGKFYIFLFILRDLIQSFIYNDCPSYLEFIPYEYHKLIKQIVYLLDHEKSICMRIFSE